MVISNHLTAQPPAIGDRIPELSGLGPAFDRALAKAPADRYATCTAFAEAMAEGLSVTAQELGATDPTVAARAARQGSKHAKFGSGSRRLRLGLLAAGVAAVLIGGAIAIGLGIGEREQPSAKSPPAASTPAQPVVLVGADCGTLGAAGPRRAESKRIARGCPRRVTRSGPSIRAPPRAASDGRARADGRGVSRRYRGAGPCLRESNREDATRMPRGHPQWQPAGAGLAAHLSQKLLQVPATCIIRPMYC